MATLKEQYLHIRKLESLNKPVEQSLYDDISEEYLDCCIGLTDEQYDDFMENDNEDKMDFIREWLVDSEQLLDKEAFESIVSDFEYELIDSYEINDSIIEWQPEEQTCFLYEDGEVVSTGSFEHLLEWFLEEVA